MSPLAPKVTKSRLAATNALKMRYPLSGHKNACLMHHLVHGSTQITHVEKISATAALTAKVHKVKNVALNFQKNITIKLKRNLGRPHHLQKHQKCNPRFTIIPPQARVFCP